MKKVLFSIDYLSGGGAERVTLKLATYFAEVFEYQVIVVVMHHTGKPAYKFSSRIKIIYVDDMIKNYNHRIHYLIKKLQMIIKIIDVNKPDAFISLAMPELNNYFVIACKLAGIKRIILSERNDPSKYPVGKISRILRLICYYTADKIVFQTEGAMNYFPTSIRKKSIIIPNPIDSTLPEPYEGNRGHKVVTFCRLEPQKNLYLLIDSFVLFNKSHPDYELYIYGDGVLKNELELYINKQYNSKNIIMHPFCSDVHERIKDASMYVLSSNYEGISNAMLEALALGIPTIATDCPPGGSREYIKNKENGILIPTQDVKALTEAMCMLAENSKLQTKISKNSVKLREQLKLSCIASKWEKEI